MRIFNSTSLKLVVSRWRRSNGYGSLEVWVRYIRTGIKFQNKFKPSEGCSKSTWNGSAFIIVGGDTWSDVYPVAQSRNVIVVGGGTPVSTHVEHLSGPLTDHGQTISCLDGWMQGGGHGPASRNHGLGADHVLEAIFVLANGSIVTANPSQHPGVFLCHPRQRWRDLRRRRFDNN